VGGGGGGGGGGEGDSQTLFNGSKKGEKGVFKVKRRWMAPPPLALHRVAEPANS